MVDANAARGTWTECTVSLAARNFSAEKRGSGTLWRHDVFRLVEQGEEAMVMAVEKQVPQVGFSRRLGTEVLAPRRTGASVRNALQYRRDTRKPW